MKYFYARVTTQYDGFEWTSLDVAEAESEKEAETIINAKDYTHDNGIEVQALSWIQEISREEYDVLHKYL